MRTLDVSPPSWRVFPTQGGPEDFDIRHASLKVRKALETWGHLADQDAPLRVEIVIVGSAIVVNEEMPELWEDPYFWETPYKKAKETHGFQWKDVRYIEIFYQPNKPKSVWDFIEETDA